MMEYECWVTPVLTADEAEQEDKQLNKAARCYSTHFPSVKVIETFSEA
jgi:hypothetical protein